MAQDSEKKFFRWFGTASVGTFIGMAAGILVGLVVGGGLGGWFWYDMRHDGFNALSDDTEDLVGFCITVGLAVAGAVVGLVGGGLIGLLASTVYSLLTGNSVNQNRER